MFYAIKSLMGESRNKILAFDNIPLSLFLALNLFCGPPPPINLFLGGDSLNILAGPADEA